MSNYHRYLLFMGANPEARAMTGTTPVYRAARNGSLEAVQTLLLVGAFVYPLLFFLRTLRAAYLSYISTINQVRRY